MIHIYYGPTGNSMRAVLALEECGLEYKRHVIDLSKKEHKSQDYLNMNPMGHVPVMIDENGPDGKKTTLSQSGIILLYAAEKTKKLIPTDPIKRYEALQWMMAALMDVHSITRLLNFTGPLKGEQAEHIHNNFETVQRNFLKVIQAQIGNKPFILDELSIADVALYPFIRVRLNVLQNHQELEPLMDWYKNFGERDTVKRAYA